MALAAAKTETYECLNCFATLTGTHADLTRAGWKRHTQRWTHVLLCKDCEEMFDKRRKARQALEKAA